ncbi:hypothetical protein BJ138DRAFT_326009 [Hygrophoropsis aurantiaca]|uniref:Uncharacterized protein n=1 Tax=Hygrophoropsis aurantiaca TaxID=72124 RepID=A0ACB8A650_9AGAM|nr:hypothetical protein BJ138DRAFT_326009 [Hygrophoropsis aurantiaca]
MRISSNGGMRPPAIANIATTPVTPVSQQSSPPRPPSTPLSNGVNGVHSLPDIDVKMSTNSNGISNNDSASPIVQATVNEVNLSPVANAQPMQPQVGSPARQKAELQQHPPPAPANGYHIPMNGYQYAHPRQHNGMPMQHMQNLKMVYPPGQDINGMHPNAGRPLANSYMGHVIAPGTHFNMQLGAGANANLKLPAGRQWTAVTSPSQQPTPLANTADGLTGAVPMSSSPSTTHTTPGTQPARTPSANGSRPATRTSSVGNVPVGHMMNAGQYTTHSLSPHLQHSPSPLLSSALALPSHQSPPRPPMTPTMKMASPSLQHQQQPVGSSQGGY